MVSSIGRAASPHTARGYLSGLRLRRRISLLAAKTIYLQCKHREVKMLRKVFRTGNSVVVSLPREALEYLDIHEGAEIEVDLDRENRRLILKPVAMPLAVAGIDENFALQVAEFIEQYRPALEELAK
jgi:antitoxin MazE